MLGADLGGVWSKILSFYPVEVYVLGALDVSGATRVQDFSELPGTQVALAPPSAAYLKPTVSLPEFDHPPDACYIVGPDPGGLDVQAAHVVSIPTHQGGELWSWMAALIVLYDREAKCHVQRS